jgi:capsular exopolysaccharide synthesis family protein
MGQAYADLSAARNALGALKSQHGVVDSEIDSLKQRLEGLPQLAIPSEKLEEALSKDVVGAGYYTQVQEIIKKIDYAQSKLVNPGPEVRKLRSNLTEIEGRLAQRREYIRPEVEKQYREKVRGELREALATANIKANSLAVQERLQEKVVQEAHTAARALDKNSRNKPLNEMVLENQIENSKAALDEITRKITLFEFEKPQPRVTLLHEAAPPTKKDFSRQLKMGGGGGLAIFGLVLFAVSFLEFRSRKISVADEVSHGLGMSVVGALPAIPAGMRRPLVGGTGTGTDVQGQIWNNQLNEAVDAVRTLLLHASRTEALRVIMVTSADSGEGKTSLASQLAASLARAWRRTLLIDGDLRNPASHTLFDLPPEPGLSEVLRGEVQVTDAIRATPLSRLWVLPAGTWDHHAIQALAQDDVRTLLEELKQQYDFIIVDSPPVLPVADSLLLGQHVDGVLFSILRDVSRAPAVYAAQQKLQPLGIRILGAVMVGADTDLGRGRYRYLTSQKVEA